MTKENIQRSIPCYSPHQQLFVFIRSHPAWQSVERFLKFHRCLRCQHTSGIISKINLLSHVACIQVGKLLKIKEAVRLTEEWDDNVYELDVTSWNLDDSLLSLSTNEQLVNRIHKLH